MPGIDQKALLDFAMGLLILDLILVVGVAGISLCVA